MPQHSEKQKAKEQAQVEEETQVDPHNNAQA